MVRTINGWYSVLRAAGSLWFAAVLLVLLLVAMACATVFESMHGTEQALATFYKSRWFELLLALLAANLLAAVVVRYPFSRGQIGFVLTHGSILLILAGALVTKHWGIEGRVGFAEGQTVKHFTVSQEALTIEKKQDKTRSSVDLDTSVFGKLRAVDHPEASILSLGNVRIEVKRYLPDSVEVRSVLNDSPHHHSAIEVSLSAPSQEGSTWVFAGRTARLGSVSVMFRMVADKDELRRLVADTPTTQPASKGTIKIAFKGSTFEFPVEDCTDQAVPLGQTGHTVRVLRYLPHAVVGGDNKIKNASTQPVNPAIEVELDGPAGKSTKLAFAKFPDFWSMHGSKQIEELKLTFVARTSNVPTVPIEVLSGPSGDMHVRFRSTGAAVVSRKLDLGTPVESPWPGRTFTVLRRFDNARIERSVAPANPIRKDRTSAVLLKLNAADYTNEIWLQKYHSHPVTIEGVPYNVTYGDKMVPLGFDLTLDRFQIVHYPGGTRPRSFESHITIVDPTTGGKQSQVISMNHPVKYRGYTCYQSSYRQEGGQTASFLSVAWDPGQPIVFAGYIALMVGMFIVLGTRMKAQRRRAGTPNSVGLQVMEP